MAGEFDEQERHIDLAKLPVILENRERGKYDVHLDLAFNGADTVFLFNMSYKADPEIAKWIQNADFRRALSVSIDRDQMNETFWLGLGTPGSIGPNESLPQSPGPEWRKKWSTYDVALANKMLDGIGLTKKDRDGYRLRTDNGQRLAIQILAVNALLPWVAHAEMVSQFWRKVGIFADVKEMERNLFLQRSMGNEHQVAVWQNGGSELLYLFPRHTLPVDTTEPYLGPEICKWFTSGGTQGSPPERPEPAQGAGAVQVGCRPAGGRPQQDGAGDLEDPDRQPVRHRHLRPIAGGTRGAHRQPQARATSQAAPASPSIAGPRAARIRKPGSSSHDRVCPEMIAFLLRRLALGLVTIWLISVMSFIIIQLPPGDFVNAYIAQLAASGSSVSAEEADAMRRLYGLGQPIYVQYFKWISRVVAGDFGESMEWRRPVLDVIGDRIWLTLLLVVRRAHPHLGAGLADRHLFGGAAILVRRLRLHAFGLPWHRRYRISCSP